MNHATIFDKTGYDLLLGNKKITSVNFCSSKFGHEVTFYINQFYSLAPYVHGSFYLPNNRLLFSINSSLPIFLSSLRRIYSNIQRYINALEIKTIMKLQLMNLFIAK